MSDGKHFENEVSVIEVTCDKRGKDFCWPHILRPARSSLLARVLAHAKNTRVSQPIYWCTSHLAGHRPQTLGRLTNFRSCTANRTTEIWANF